MRLTKVVGIAADAPPRTGRLDLNGRATDLDGLRPLDGSGDSQKLSRAPVLTWLFRRSVGVVMATQFASSGRSLRPGKDAFRTNKRAYLTRQSGNRRRVQIWNLNA
jgi:hypothetical protein